MSVLPKYPPKAMNPDTPDAVWVLEYHFFHKDANNASWSISAMNGAKYHTLEEIVELGTFTITRAPHLYRLKNVVTHEVIPWIAL